MEKSKLFKGALLGSYQLQSLLGHGNSGEVWSAFDRDCKTIVALKIYDSNHHEASYEYQMMCVSDNDYIIHPIKYVVIQGLSIIVLPYYISRSVDAIAGFFREKEMWLLLKNVSNAIMDLNSRGYGHFDIKPSNILIADDGFILSDFGACMRFDVPLNRDDSVTAIDSSSFRFDAPERNSSVRKESDIWSLGATAFYLYLGSHVFFGLGGRGQHKKSVIPYLRKDVPVLSSLISRCLNFEPKDRPSVSDINQIATEQYNILQTQNENHPALKSNMNSTKSLESANDDSDFWPEEMYATT